MMYASKKNQDHPLLQPQQVAVRWEPNLQSTHRRESHHCSVHCKSVPGKSWRGIFAVVPASQSNPVQSNGAQGGRRRNPSQGRAERRSLETWGNTNQLATWDRMVQDQVRSTWVHVRRTDVLQYSVLEAVTSNPDHPGHAQFLPAPAPFTFPSPCRACCPRPVPVPPSLFLSHSSPSFPPPNHAMHSSPSSSSSS